MDGKQPFELLQVGLDGGLHVRVLQLARQQRVVERARAVHLPERRCCGRAVLEACELALPVGAELGHHPSLDERPAHRRRFALQPLQLGDIFRRQHIRNCRHQLRDLHDRPFEAAERGRELERVTRSIELEPEHARTDEPRRYAAHIGADARIARGTGGKSVGFAVGHVLVLSTGR